jgi:hypothetical protein
MAEANFTGEIRGRGSSRVLLRIAEAVREAAPSIRPEVVRLGESVQGLLIQVAPSQHLVLEHADGQWTCHDMYIDEETGEPDADPLLRRLMRESRRPLPVSDPRDVSEVAHRFLRRAITAWNVTVEHEFTQERERQFAAEALAGIPSASLTFEMRHRR